MPLDDSVDTILTVTFEATQTDQNLLRFAAGEKHIPALIGFQHTWPKPVKIVNRKLPSGQTIETYRYASDQKEYDALVASNVKETQKLLAKRITSKIKPLSRGRSALHCLPIPRPNQSRDQTKSKRTKFNRTAFAVSTTDTRKSMDSVYTQIVPYIPRTLALKIPPHRTPQLLTLPLHILGEIVSHLFWSPKWGTTVNPAHYRQDVLPLFKAVPTLFLKLMQHQTYKHRILEARFEANQLIDYRWP